MLTNERIRELAQDHYSESYENSLSCGQVEHLRKLRNKDTADALCELLALRAEVKEWREDGNMLFGLLEESVLVYDPKFDQYYCECCGNAIAHRGKVGDTHTENCVIGKHLAQHSALVEKYSATHGKA